MTAIKTSRKKLDTNARYEATIDKKLLRFTKEGGITLEQVTDAAARVGEPVNAYIVRAIRERMEREGVDA